LLRAEFATLRPQASKRRRESLAAERILIAMGLTDLGSITLRVVKAAAAASPAMSFDIVLGAGAKSLEPLEAMAREDARIHIHVDPEDLARLMLEADIGIGALGTMTWERCCLGLASIGIVLADNQRAIAEEVDRAAAVLIIRDAAQLEARLPELLDRLSSDAALRHSLSRNAAAIVDGQGSRRVARAMLEMVPR
jgi:spore coat polysaccharide biosynthesis predicted glycosyltransferase SpsG